MKEFTLVIGLLISLVTNGQLTQFVDRLESDLFPNNELQQAIERIHITDLSEVNLMSHLIMSSDTSELDKIAFLHVKRAFLVNHIHRTDTISYTDDYKKVVRMRARLKNPDLYLFSAYMLLKDAIRYKYDGSHYQQVLIEGLENNDVSETLKGMMALLIGNISIQYYDYETAISYFKLADEYHQKSDLKIVGIKPLTNLLGVYNQIKDERNMRSIENILFERVEKEDYLNMGVMYSALGNAVALYPSKKKRIELLKKSISNFEKLDKVYDITLANIRLADLYLLEENFEEARKCIEIAKSNYQLHKSNKNVYEYIHLITIEGYYQLATGNTEKGISIVEDAYTKAKEEGVSILYKQLLTSLHRQYSKIGNHQQAYSYLKTLHSYNDSVLNLERIQGYQNLEIKYKVAQNVQQINSLKNESALKAKLLDEEERSNNRLVLFLLLVSILTVVLSWLFFQKNNLSVRLTKSNEVKDKIFSILSHDLRGPLNTFRSLVELSQRKALNHSDYQRYLGIMQREVGDTNMLLESLLIWSKNNQNQITVEYNQFEALSEIKKMIRLFESSCKERNLEISFSGLPEADIFTDLNLFQFIVRNIIHNAIKFSPNNSSIAIDVVEEDEHIVLRVTDEGKGMSAEVIERFYHGTMESGVDTNGIKSTGLGLMLCKEFADKVSMKIRVESLPGKGTCFQITIPPVSILLEHEQDASS